MRRKLIKQGGFGLTIYLPKHWTDEKELQAGQEVEVNRFESMYFLKLDWLHSSINTKFNCGSQKLCNYVLVEITK